MRFLRIGVCSLLVFAVAAHGGVEEWSLAVLITGAAVLLVAWAAVLVFSREEQVVVSPLLAPLCLFGFLAVGQWLFHGTASAFDTRIALQLFAADLILLFLFMQAFRTLPEWRSFIWFVTSFGFIVAVFGILQHLTFNGKLYWFRPMHYGGIPFGPYVNRNHFAGLMELVIPIGLVPLVMGRVRRERWFLVGLFTMLPTAALFLSASRGGIVSLALELCVLAVLLWLYRAGGRHALVGAAVLLLAVLMVSWLGAQQILHRFSAMQSLEVTSGKRASMREGAWHILLDHPWVGTGLGTLEEVYPPYETMYDGKIVNHIHNDYLEALAETGVLGGLCCAWFLGVLALQGLRRPRRERSQFVASLQLAGLVGCVGFLAHSFVDFNLHIPSNLLLFFFLAHLATADFEPAPAHPGYPFRGSKSMIDNSPRPV